MPDDFHGGGDQPSAALEVDGRLAFDKFACSVDMFDPFDLLGISTRAEVETFLSTRA